MKFFNSILALSLLTFGTSQLQAVSNQVGQISSDFTVSCQMEDAILFSIENKSDKDVYIKLYSGEKLSKEEYKINSRGNIKLPKKSLLGICSTFNAFKVETVPHGTSSVTGLKKLFKACKFCYRKPQHGYAYVIKSVKGSSIEWQVSSKETYKFNSKRKSIGKVSFPKLNIYAKPLK